MGKEKGGEADKYDKKIMCVRKEALFAGSQDYFEGFRTEDFVDFQTRALRHFEWIRRGDVEKNPDWKQIIPYVAVVNPEKGLWMYRRASKKEHYHEKRLAGKLSGGIGGHIDETNAANPIVEGRNREVREEIQQPNKSPIKVERYSVLGFLNQDSPMEYGFSPEEVSVGQVHFGVLIAALTNAKKIIGKDLEIAEGGFKSGMEIEAMCADSNIVVEPWTRLAAPTLIKHINQSPPF